MKATVKPEQIDKMLAEYLIRFDQMTEEQQKNEIKEIVNIKVERV